MDIQNLQREFRYNGVVLADPNQAFTLPQVRDFYANVYPEITSADIEGPEQVGAKVIYTFRRAVGTKGAGLTREVALQRLRTGGRLMSAQRPAHVISTEQARQPLGQQLKGIIAQHRNGRGPRCLAPSVNHAVLP
jgi:PRTRC genetic system protein C